jgi:Flp pilus assembly protein TadG
MSSINFRRSAIRSAGCTRRGNLFRRSGGATLELALTLSILFSICYGLIEFGYFYYVKNTMEGAAREGCRAGIVTGATSANCNSAIINQLQAANLIPNGTTASGSGATYTIGSYTVEYFDNGAAASSGVSSIPTGDTLTVQITATWGTVGAGFSPAHMIGTSKQILTASAMRVEG